jgi:hypothetical protein
LNYFRTLGVLVLLASLSGYAMSATVQVGTCKPQLTSFSTIQSAVIASGPGTTILVCPGNYPEQVSINKALNLKGVQSGTADAAVIIAPVGGTVANTASLASGNPIAAQVLVMDTTGVNISNLTIDGNNNLIGGCGLNLIGIYYRNASGVVDHAAVVNQALTAALNGCQSGLGIFAQSGSGGKSKVTISDSHVQNYQKNGITGNELGTTINILENTVVGQGSTTGAAENSIQLGFGAKGVVISNTVIDDVWAPDTFADPGDAAAGILIFASSGVIVAGNTVGNTQFGIAFVSDSTFGSADNGTITWNKVSATHIFDGIDLCSNSNTVRNNLITGSDESAIHVDSSCGAVKNNHVSDNTINKSCAGILVGTAAGPNSIGGNTFFNVGNTVMQADQCTATQFSALSTASSAVAKSSKSNPVPARP